VCGRAVSLQKDVLTTLDRMPTSLRRQYDVVTDRGLFTELHRLEQLANDDVPFLETLATSDQPVGFVDPDVVTRLRNVTSYGIELTTDCRAGTCPAVRNEAIDKIIYCLQRDVHIRGVYRGKWTQLASILAQGRTEFSRGRIG